MARQFQGVQAASENTDRARARNEAAYGSQRPGNVGIYQPLDEETEAARARYEQYLRERGERGVAPTVVAQDVREPDPVYASQQDPIERVQNLERVGTPRDVQVQLGSEARGMATPERLAAERGREVVIDTRASDQVRGIQTGDYIQQLRAAALGQAPSVAQAQFDAAKGDIVSGALGTASQARGNDRLAARLAAQNIIADQTRRMALDKAGLRAQEITAARSELGRGLEGVRGQDQGLATDQARITQTTSLADQSETNRMAAENIRNRMEADRFSAAAQNERDVTRAGMLVDTEAGNVERRMAGEATNAASANRARELDAQAQNRRAETTAARTDAAAQSSADRTVAVRTGNADRSLEGQQTNAQSQIQTRGQDLDQDASLRQSAEQAAGTASQMAQTRAQGRITEEQGKREAKAKIAGGVISGVAGVGAGLATSDRRLKRDIRPERDQELDDLLRRLEDSYSYHYRNPADGAGERHGPMAQDLERSAIGRDLVERDAQGMRLVDLDAFTMALGAAVGRLNERLETIEGRR